MHSITQLGPHSFTLGLDLEADFIPALTDLFTNYSTGWTIHDSPANGLTGLRLAVRSLCEDGVTYKYVVFEVNTYVYVRVYENWNNLTHTGTNETEGSNRVGFLSNASMTNGFVHIFVSERWCALCVQANGSSTINSNTGNTGRQGIYGCFEIKRDNPGNTQAFGELPFLYMHTAQMTSTRTDGIAGYGDISKPRVRALVTTNARMYVGCLWGLCGYTIGSSQRLGNLASTITVDPWTGQPFALELYAIHQASGELDGRIHGLKLSGRTAQALLYQTDVKTDAEFFVDDDGIETPHLVVLSDTVSGGTAANAFRFLIPA